MRKTLATIALTVGLVFAAAPAFADTWADQPMCNTVNDSTGTSCTVPAPTHPEWQAETYNDFPCASTNDLPNGGECFVGPTSSIVPSSLNLKAHHRRHHHHH